ncbi:hypothetical protein [Caldicellulosiruptor sp. F32]|uniref:hypothetical protein n=1 Tax=Caldicellulosiruptor sp. F32 TaxID=1214564 RepID=UPI0003A152F5|nr:hypothetical protein [Caldicellulosiruptor sp. F32]
MSIWKLKLKAFLHDPLDKQWVLSLDKGESDPKPKLNIQNFMCPKNKNHEAIHEIVAERFLNYIIPNECIEEFSELTKIADKISYPLNEILGEGLKRKTSTVRKPEEIHFHDIYSRKIQKKSHSQIL